MACHRFGVVGGLGVLVALMSASLAGQAPARTAAKAAAKKPAAAATAAKKPWTQPRTPWGDPDLQGTWVGTTNAPLERDPKLGDAEYITLTDAEVAQRLAQAKARKALQAEGKVENRGFRVLPNYNGIFDYSEAEPKIAKRQRTSAIVDPPNGRLPPWTLEQVKRWEMREAATRGHGESDSIDDINIGYRCITVVSGPEVTNWGLSFGGGKSVGIGRTENPAEDVSENDGLGGGSSAGPVRQILQSPGYIAFVLGDNAYRIIPLDGRRAPGDKIRQWLGVPHAHWDGNALVVEITNIKMAFPVIPNFGGSLYPGSGETLRVVERFTRTAAGTMEYRLTIDDPGVYTRPYTVLHELGRDENYKSYSTNICQEDPKDLANAFTNARADEQNSLQAGEDSVAVRQPRVEQLKKEALEAASRQAGPRSGKSDQ